MNNDKSIYVQCDKDNIIKITHPMLLMSQTWNV